MPECSRCEAEFEEEELIQRTQTRHGVKSGEPRNFCGYCFLASEVLRFTRGPIQEREDMAVHPVRVYSRELAKAVKARNGKEEELQGAYDRLLTESVQEHAPEWIQNHLEQAAKAIRGDLPAFDDREDEQDDSEQQKTLQDSKTTPGDRE